MRVMALTLIGLVGVAGCTNYQPLPPGGGGSWEEARRNLYGERAGGADAGAPAAPVTDTPVTDAPTTSPTPTAPTAFPGTAADPASPELEPKPLPPLRTTSSAPAETTAPRRDAPVVAAARPDAPVDQPASTARAPVEEPAATPEPAGADTAAEDPVVAAEAPVVAAEAAAEAAPTAASDAALPPPALSGVGFLWPVPAAGEGVRVTEIGEQGALAIEAAAGEAFVAAENGVVVFAGDDLEAYGRMVVIRHDGDYTTAYGHAERLDVAVGDVVRRGQQLGLIGTTGGVVDPQLYFEMRVGSRVVDPRAYLVEAPRLVAGG